MEVENCDSNFVCICGVTVQYRNDIYVLRTCGGIFLQGILSGDADFISLAFAFVSNKQYSLKYLLSF